MMQLLLFVGLMLRPVFSLTTLLLAVDWWTQTGWYLARPRSRVSEIIVRVDRKHTFVARESGTDTFVLIDAVVGRLERQLVKHKEKTRNHKHDGKSEVVTEE